MLCIVLCWCNVVLILLVSVVVFVVSVVLCWVVMVSIVNCCSVVIVKMLDGIRNGSVYVLLVGWNFDWIRLIGWDGGL